MHGVFVTGTDTGVGKTYIGAAVIRQLVTRGGSVLPRKPVESGCEVKFGEPYPADAAILYVAADRPGNLMDVCPYRFRQALSPARAARLAGQQLTIDNLEQASVKDVTDETFLWVEGAGGFYSPLAIDGLNADLATRLGLPVLLVAADQLGCINHVLLTLQAIRRRGLKLIAVVLNRVSANSVADMDNAEDLRQMIESPVFEIAHEENRAVNPQGTQLTELLIQAT